MLSWELGCTLAISALRRLRKEHLAFKANWGYPESLGQGLGYSQC